MADALSVLAPVEVTATEFRDPALVFRHLAHELRQPLSTIESIACYVQMVLPPDESKLRPQINKLDLMVEQANWILDDALHFLGVAPAQPQLLDLHEVLAEELAETDPEERRPCRTETGSRRAVVRMDAAQARHLVRGLLAMGRKMARQNGEIEVHAWVDEDESWLEVTVCGVEYAGEELRRMFEPFAPHLPSGSGLALASAHRIVAAHHGRLEASCRPGIGTRFLARIPLAG